jgi:hypothetical protein
MGSASGNGRFSGFRKPDGLTVRAKAGLNRRHRNGRYLRRAGELLIEMGKNGERHSGRGDQKSESRPATPKLSSYGITKDQSSKWQKLARMPEEKFGKRQFTEALRELTAA